MSWMYETANILDTESETRFFLLSHGQVSVAMHWWQWVLQIVGAWFCLAIVASGLWIAFVRLWRRPRWAKPAPEDLAGRRAT